MAESTIFEEEQGLDTVACDRCGSFIHLEQVYLSPAGKLCRWCLFRLWLVRLFAGRS